MSDLGYIVAGAQVDLSDARSHAIAARDKISRTRSQLDRLPELDREQDDFLYRLEEIQDELNDIIDSMPSLHDLGDLFR